MKIGRIGVGVVIVCTLSLVFVFDVHHFLTLEYITQKKSNLQAWVDQYFYQSVVIFTVIYIVITALSIPGALVMTLLVGALFGLLWGMVIASVGSTLGATIAFLGSRFLVQSWVEEHFPKQINVINSGIAKEGISYLFALRLIPIFPFFLVNLVMGLTRIPTFTYMWVSQLGMLAGTFVFVNAGRELSKIQALGDITSPGLIASFIILGVFPIIAKSALRWWKLRRSLINYDTPRKFDRNLIVIGAGAGGLVSSYIAATVKAKVTLIEKHKMGGDCLNTGCVPSKALIKAGKVAFEARHAHELGIHVDSVAVDFKKVMARVQDTIKQVEPHDSVERYSQLGVECIHGEAQIKSPYSVVVNGDVLTTRAIIVASGARPFVPDYKGLRDVSFFTSDTIWNIQELPQRLLIVGSGPIACELAQAFQRLGSHVILLARSSRLMSKEDNEVSEFVKTTLDNEGVELRMNFRLKEFVHDNGKQAAICETDTGICEIVFTEVLFALGREANTKGFGLEDLNIRLNDNGTIKTDEYLRTSISTIFACGDVAGPYQFTHMAAHQAWYASVNALFGWIRKFKVDYSVVPWVTYVDPEVARVGINENEAKSQGLDYEVSSYQLSDLDRAITDHNNRGFVKVITKRGKDRILGVTIVGQNAGELIAEFVLAMKKDIGLNGILSTIHSYPTMAEANKYVAGEWKRNHAPTKLIGYLEWLLSWRRG